MQLRGDRGVGWSALLGASVIGIFWGVSLLGLDRFAFDAGDREENDAEREPQHSLRNAGSSRVFERGSKRAHTRERKENGTDVEECDFSSRVDWHGC